VIVATALLMVLATVALPLADLVSQREKEDRLRQSLQEMRIALDRYQQRYDTFPASMGNLLMATDTQSGGGYFLRRWPINPMATATPFTWWEIASRTSLTQPDKVRWYKISSPSHTLPDTTPIVDIRCPAELGTGINGIPYREW